MSDNGQSYEAFLQRKAQVGGDDGFEPLWMPDWLFDFQKHLVKWAASAANSTATYPPNEPQSHRITLGPAVYYLAVCVRHPTGFIGGASGFKRVDSRHADHGPIIVEHGEGSEKRETQS